MKKILIMIMVLIPLSVMADSKGLITKKMGRDCEDDPRYRNATADVINMCLIEKQGNTKAPLNKAYKRVEDSIKTGFLGVYDADELLSKLEKSQRTWLALRKAQCELEAELNGGGVNYDLIEQTCINYLNKQRTDYFNSIKVPE